MYPTFAVRRLHEVPHHCCDNRLDGGFLPQVFDTAPHADADPWANSRRRGMRFGPPARVDVPPDVVPAGRRATRRRDAPWTTTSKPKLFSQPPYWTPQQPQEAVPEGGLKASPPKKAPARRKTLAPMRAGRMADPYSSYPHSPDLAVPQGDSPFTGKNLRTGRAPDHFDPHVYAGPQMVSGKGRPGGYVPTRVGKLKTNLKKKDTFGDFPAYMPDPYKDNPLGDGPCCRRGGLLVPCVARGKPNMPIVNVWDPPDGLQTKGGVRRTTITTTTMTQPERLGEVAFTLSDKGRLGTTM